MCPWHTYVLSLPVFLRLKACCVLSDVALSRQARTMQAIDRV